MTKNEITEYWIESSDNDFRAMMHLYQKKDYTWSLFLGHLKNKKLLKAFYVKNVDNNPIFTHDLLRITTKCDIELDEEQKDFLDTLSTFNIRTRYDDYKFEFYKRCTQKYTNEWIDKIKDFRKWIKTKL